jgi:hypothetical protein
MEFQGSLKALIEEAADAACVFPLRRTSIIEKKVYRISLAMRNHIVVYLNHYC